MYYQTAYALMPGLQCVDARRVLDLQQYKYLMEKHHHVCVLDPFEPIRRLAMAERRSRNPEKPLTSFRISDILSGDDTDCPQNKNYPVRQRADKLTQYTANKTRESSDERESRVKRFRSSTSESDNETNTNDKEEDLQKNIVRPWNFSPKCSDQTDNETKFISKYCIKNSDLYKSERTASPTNSNSRNSLSSDEFRLGKNGPNFTKSKTVNRQYILKMCNSSSKYEYESDGEEEIDVEGCEDEDDSDVSFSQSDRGDVSPLDALVAMSSKTFMGLESFEDRQNRENDQHNKNQMPKKKRKTRTAFTNQQIYELEKRFILQKYLTPSDRDEIAAKLGLTCAQVITWFQNRRAKFKRDIEELKNDVVATSPKPE